jgi:uncharacterized protein (DUF427 family)
VALTFGTGPFGPDGGHFDFGPLPEHIRYWEPWTRRMRAVVSGETVLDSRDGVLLHESGTFPAHYYPLADFRAELLQPAPAAHDGSQRWSILVGERLVEACVTAWSWAPGVDKAPLLEGYATVDFEAIDRWFEEDDPVYAHPRDPYHRVDVRSSSRHVVVRHGGELVAESTRPKLLFETSNPIRYYLPFDDVRSELLETSQTISECPYKGDGQHWHLLTADGRIDDAAWSLPHPLPEGIAAAQHICFYPEKVELVVDGAPVER